MRDEVGEVGAAAAERVLDAAARLFAERGYQAVSMDELRAASGVALKRIYQLYPSKTALIEAVLHARHEEWTRGVSAAVGSAGTPRDRLLAVYDFLEDWFGTDGYRGCAFINAFGELGAVSPHLAQLAREHKESFQRYLAEVAAEAGAPPALAPQLALLAEGAQTTAAIAGSPEAARHAREAARVLIGAALP